LEEISKEEIIKRFISLEFTRFLDYYKNAPDLNEKADARRDSRDDRDGRGGRREGRGRRDGRDGGRERKDSRDFKGKREGRGDGKESKFGRDSRDGGKDRFKSKGSGKFSRFFINLGRKDGLIAKSVIGMINDNTNDRDIKIGDIDIKESFSFFEVEEKSKAKVLSSFKGSQYKGRAVNVEIAEALDPSKKRRKRKED
jgi:ATP-dependent RNA helicase DeaD